MVAFTSYSLVPELQSAYGKFILSTTLNRDQIDNPVIIPDMYLTENSFLNMLFNNDYNLSDYSYLFDNQDPASVVPRIATTRLQIYPGSSKYLIMDDEGSNIFNLQADDFLMLDSLLAYRNDSTALTIIDSTTVTVFDSTSNVLATSFDILTTELSKMIYLYLNLEIYEVYSDYNNLQIISTGGLLETCYETYLIEQFFVFITTQRKSNLLFDNCEVT